MNTHWASNKPYFIVSCANSWKLRRTINIENVARQKQIFLAHLRLNGVLLVVWWRYYLLISIPQLLVQILNNTCFRLEMYIFIVLFQLTLLLLDQNLLCCLIWIFLCKFPSRSLRYRFLQKWRCQIYKHEP